MSAMQLIAFCKMNKTFTSPIQKTDLEFHHSTKLNASLVTTKRKENLDGHTQIVMKKTLRLI